MKKVVLSIVAICCYIGVKAQLTYRTLGTSGNAFSIQDGKVNSLAVNNQLGTIVFIHRTNGKQFTSDDQNHGQYRFDISKDKGATWTINNGLLNPSGTESGKACRFPNVTIHNNNPTNTNPDSAFLVYLGTFHKGGSIPAGSPTWIRNTHGRARLNNSQYTDQVYRAAYATAGKDIGIANNLINGKYGEFWYTNEIDSPISATTVRVDTILYLNKGTWQPGPDTVQWTAIPFKASFKDIDLNTFSPKVAFSANKKYGYFTFIGDFIGNNMHTLNYYSSSDSGATWSSKMTTVNLHNVVGIDTTNESGLNKVQIIDYAPIIDSNGSLHFAAITGITDMTTVADYIANNSTDDNTRMYYIGNDTSLPATCRWYGYDMGKVNKIRGTLASGASGNYVGSNRLQASMTPDGLFGFFSWVDNLDPNGTDNSKPNIRVFGVNMLNKKVSKVVDVTKNDPKFGAAALQFKTSTEVIENNNGTVELPFVVISFQTPNSPNSDDPITYYYIDNFNFKKSDIKTSVLGPKIAFATISSTDTFYIRLNSNNVPVFTYPAYVKSRLGCGGIDFVVPGAIVDTPKFLPTANGGVGFISYRIILGTDTDMVTVPVMAFNDPVVSFTFASSGAANNIKFTNTSDAGKYRISKWLWNFSAPPTSTLKDPTKLFTTKGKFAVTLTGTNELVNASGSKTDTVIITSLGIFQNENVDKEIKLYPNPATDRFTLSTTQTYDKFNVTIIDIKGTQVYSEREYGKTNGKIPVNISRIPSGEYFVIIDTEEGYSVKKLSISK